MESIGAVAPPAPEGAPADPTSVYRYYDRHDVLIYVGITKQGMGRNLQHNGKAEWWQYVVRQELEHLPSRAAAMAREKALIQQYRPPFNRQHNVDHETFRAAYLHWAAVKGGMSESAEVLVARLARRLPFDLAECSATRLVLRSQIEHRPLASVVKLAGRGLPVWLADDNRKVSRVEEVQYAGPFTLLICTAPTRPLPAAETLRAHASLKWRRPPQVPAALIRQVVLRSAEGPVVG